MICYENDCIMHESEKQEEYYSQALKKYYKKKKWNKQLEIQKNQK